MRPGYDSNGFPVGRELTTAEAELVQILGKLRERGFAEGVGQRGLSQLPTVPELRAEALAVLGRAKREERKRIVTYLRERAAEGYRGDRAYADWDLLETAAEVLEGW